MAKFELLLRLTCLCSLLALSQQSHVVKSVKSTSTSPPTSTTYPRKVLIQNHDFKDDSAFENKFWDQYKRGFGKPFSSEFWLGLDEIHRITQNGRWSIMYEVVWDKNVDGWGRHPTPDPRAGTTGRVEMNDFKVASEAYNYQISIGQMRSKENWGGSESDVNDWEREINLMDFSTTDHDNDKKGNGNCASDPRYGGGGGWWFNSCYITCLNCRGSYRIVFDGDHRLPASSAIWLQSTD